MQEDKDAACGCGLGGGAAPHTCFCAMAEATQRGWLATHMQDVAPGDKPNPSTWVPSRRQDPRSHCWHEEACQEWLWGTGSPVLPRSFGLRFVGADLSFPPWGCRVPPTRSCPHWLSPLSFMPPVHRRHQQQAGRAGELRV